VETQDIMRLSKRNLYGIFALATVALTDMGQRAKNVA